ncbi:nucleotide modification associated domain-containing protein [Lactobacillus intestinalis]|uniref:nucleotide modification associated domain-containing protein n=1 Tax=Lactobacillus intestinalis TaxID=151781 RepID=UPI00266F82B6|nr:nucleotide modification associated domain-containing protein [Lactobacillus intestinalis]
MVTVLLNRLINMVYQPIGVRLSDKYNRIEHLITNNELKENDESLEDTLLDMAGYSILALRYLKEHKDENYRG